MLTQNNLRNLGLTVKPNKPKSKARFLNSVKKELQRLKLVRNLKRMRWFGEGTILLCRKQQRCCTHVLSSRKEIANRYGHIFKFVTVVIPRRC